MPVAVSRQPISLHLFAAARFVPSTDISRTSLPVFSSIGRGIILAARSPAMRRVARIVTIALLCGAPFPISQRVAACTAFCAVGAGQVLVGNNEDWTNPRTRIWFVPAKPGSLGRMYVGFDDLWPQGGLNERGLWFDGFAAPAIAATGSSDLPSFPGNIVDTAMAECGTVEEVVRLFSRYNRTFLRESILMFADASGDAVAIERNAIVRKTRSHFVQTNFHQSRAPDGIDERFITASTMLERAGSDISIDLFRRILAATHQKGGAPTLYSNIYNLTARTMHLYYFHDFERVVTFDLAEELKKGERVLDISALFPTNAAAEAFAARRSEAGGIPGGVVMAALAAIVLAAVAVVVFGCIRAGRGFRIGVAVVAGAMVLLVASTAAVLRMPRPASASWIEFSIAPAFGESSTINSTTIRSNGVTLRTALAMAYGIPSVRVIGPPWLGDTRYAINAVAGLDSPESFQSLLQHELKNRLRLVTHVEPRPFDVLVLTATDASRLERSNRQKAAIWVGRQDAQLQGASMENLASTLQSIVGRPVIDDTGITGSYNLELQWEEDRIASLSAALQHRFGLQLSPATRNLDALIVDSIQRDAALLLLAQVGRFTRAAPLVVRQRLADIMTIR
jgi:uncharacterized protein (TIGR03435 family)